MIRFEKNLLFRFISQILIKKGKKKPPPFSAVHVALLLNVPRCLTRATVQTQEAPKGTVVERKVVGLIVGVTLSSPNSRHCNRALPVGRRVTVSHKHEHDMLLTTHRSD
jgi:hypothetical protein